jgi:hypothetical protein
MATRIFTLDEQVRANADAWLEEHARDQVVAVEDVRRLLISKQYVMAELASLRKVASIMSHYARSRCRRTGARRGRIVTLRAFHNLERSSLIQWTR